MRINHVVIAKLALHFDAVGQKLPASWLAFYFQAIGIKTLKGQDYDPDGRGIYRAIHVAYDEIAAKPGYQFVADAIANVFTKANGSPAWA